MNFSPSDIDKFRRTNELSTNDVLKLLDDCEEIINTCEDYDEFFDYAGLLAGNIDIRLSYDIVDKALAVLTKFRKNVKNSKNIAVCEYGFFQIYARMGFTPKIVEHALNVIDCEDTPPLFRYAVTNELSLSTCAVGLYELALYYNEETAKAGREVSGMSPVQLDIINKSNAAFIMAVSGMKGEFPALLADIKETLELNRDNPAIKDIESSVSVDILYLESRLNGITDELVEKYANCIRVVANKDKDSKYYFHTCSTDLLLLDEMNKLDYTTECAEICKMILSRPDCFMVDYCALYKVLLDAYVRDPSCLSPSEFTDYREKYILSLEKEKKDHETTIRRLVAEEFQMRNAKSVINSLTRESETDSLTGIYNRHGFNKQSPLFYKAYPEGLVIFMDLDNLKFANDHFGHEAGDLYITTFSNSVKRVVKSETDMFFRYAGDEFVILTSRSKEEAEAIIASVQEILKTPARLKDIELLVKFSHGIASFTECPGDNTLEATVKLADSRMYECKMEHKRLDPTSVR